MSSSPAAETLAPGEILLREAWRSFSPRGDRGGTLKELFAAFGRRAAPALPATQALAGVSLHIAPGETVGVVGRNGAGKTSTLRVLAGIVPLQRGFAGCGGRVATLIELGAGFGREFTGRENIELSAALHGMDRREVAARMEAVIEFSELGHFIDAPIKTYSSGMLVRLGFAIAAHLEADTLLIDEVLAVGDEAFQRKCLRHIRSRIAEGTTVVLVSHAPGTIQQACRRVVVLDGGRVAYDGPTEKGLAFYARLLGAGERERAATRGHAGAVTVGQATLTDDSGGSRQIFSPEDALHLDLELIAAPGAPDVRLVVDVRRDFSTTVFRAATPVRTSAGGGRLRWQVPRLGLLDGDYDLLIGIHEPGDSAPGVDRTLSFSVSGAEEGTEGISDLRGEWSYEPATVRVGR